MAPPQPRVAAARPARGRRRGRGCRRRPRCTRSPGRRASRGRSGRRRARRGPAPPPRRAVSRSARRRGSSRARQQASAAWMLPTPASSAWSSSATLTGRRVRDSAAASAAASMPSAHRDRAPAPRCPAAPQKRCGRYEPEPSEHPWVVVVEPGPSSRPTARRTWAAGGRGGAGPPPVMPRCERRPTGPSGGASVRSRCLPWRSTLSTRAPERARASAAGEPGRTSRRARGSRTTATMVRAQRQAAQRAGGELDLGELGHQRRRAKAGQEEAVGAVAVRQELAACSRRRPAPRPAPPPAAARAAPGRTAAWRR